MNSEWFLFNSIDNNVTNWDSNSLPGSDSLTPTYYFHTLIHSKPNAANKKKVHSIHMLRSKCCASIHLCHTSSSHRTDRSRERARRIYHFEVQFCNLFGKVVNWADTHQILYLSEQIEMRRRSNGKKRRNHSAIKAILQTNEGTKRIYK